jgi:hypothetical protein
MGRSSVPRLAPRWSRRRGQVEPARAHLQTTLPREISPGQTVPGVLKALPVFALVDTLVRLVMGRSATRPHTGVERSSGVEVRRWLGAPSLGLP